MTSKSILIRKSDRKQFKVTFLTHWSDIESLDGEETDSVKWYGCDTEGELYVGHKGGSYVVPKEG